MTTADKRTAILKATLDLISVKGFHGAPMSMIAKEAGVSAGIIYHYFESKDALIDELFGAIKRELGQAIAADYDDNLPLWERFRRIWMNTARYYIQHPQEAAFIEQYVNSPFYAVEKEAEYLAYYLPVIQIIEHARREQVIKDLPDMVLYALTMEVANSLAQKHATNMLTVTEELLEQIVEACWDAIRR